MKHIDNLFKEELGSHTETPPSAVWDALEKRLNEKRKKRAFPYRWFWYISLVSFVILLGAAGIWKMKSDVHSDAVITASAENVMPSKKDVAAATPASNTNDHFVTNNIPHDIHTEHHHNKRTSVATLANSTKRVASHKVKAIKQEPAKVPQSDKNKTDDELYADTDDDQYTVGYSSNSRKNTASENESLPSDYIIEQRNQDNILVAEMSPEQHVRETGYGNRHSTHTTPQNLQNANTPDRQANTLSSTSSQYHTIYAANNTPKYNNHTPAHSKGHEHKATVTNTAVAPNTQTDKPALIQSETTATNYKRKHKVISRRINHTNVDVAAAKPATKTTEKQLAVVAPAKEKKNINTNIKKPVSEHIVVAAAPVIKTKAVKQPAAAMPAKEKAQVNNTDQQIVAKKADNHKISSPPATEKTIAAVNTPKNNAGSVPAPATQPATVVNARVNTNKVITADNVDKKETTASKKKKNAHTQLPQNTNPAINANAVVVKNNAPANNTNSTNKHVEPKKEVIDEKQHIQPVTTSIANKSVVKHTKKQSVGHQEKTQVTAQKSTSGSVPKLTASADNSNAPSEKIVAKTERLADKKPVIKEDTHLTIVAANVAIKKPLKEKHTTAGKAIPVKDAEIIAATEKQTSGPETASKGPHTDPKTPAEQKAIAKAENKKGRKETSRIGGNTAKNTNNTVSPPPAAPPVFVYSNSISKRSLEEETVIADNVRVNSFNAQHNDTSNNAGLIPATFKQNETGIFKPDSTANIAATDTTTKRHWFSGHFEAGVKAGYEMGFNKFAADKVIVSPYIQYNLNDKFAILTQPAFKVSHLGKINIGSSKSYVKALQGGPSGVIDSGVLITYGNSGGISYAIQEEVREYNYTQTYDSIVKSNSLGRTYTEFEMPLLFKYKISKQLSVYGGVNIAYSKMISIAENTYTSGPLIKHGIGVTIAAVGQPAPTPPPVSSVIQYLDSSITTYKNPYPSPSGDMLRLGYMLGFSYEFKKRWLFDVLVQQAIAKPNNEGGINTNAPLSVPYFRFTLGYKLTK